MLQSSWGMNSDVELILYDHNQWNYNESFDFLNPAGAQNISCLRTLSLDYLPIKLCLI